MRFVTRQMNWPVMKKPRWTIRALLIATFVVALMLAGIHWQRENAKKRALAISAVDQLHGTYGIRYIGPKWYRTVMEHFGVESKGFYDPSRVSLGPQNQGYDPTRPITNDDIKALAPHLAQFRNLELLDFQYCDLVTDDAVHFLPVFPKLTLIRVTGTGLTKEGVQALQQKYPNAKVSNSS